MKNRLQKQVLLRLENCEYRELPEGILRDDVWRSPFGGSRGELDS